MPVHHVPPAHPPHAALLIDFDNVTLGIRSDLSKEFRSLLNSDVIKGKVAVQRAYADWRRYPQYIVPLSESSIDLIFAPAFGTNKKNATDIRLAVDAIELVFTRPEIGTFILLSGDSDFSSLVIKLKEYGKFVIGVGIRESASELLIQNCDQYWSYDELAGLKKEEGPASTQRDPWDLVGDAVSQMARNRDVMRSDRLKQVMQQIDPHFDERNAGYNRFSKFVTEAGSRGLIKVAKLDNGQFEVGPPARRGGKAAAPSAGAPSEPARGGRGTGGRGRGRGRAVPQDTPSPPMAPPSARRVAGARARGTRAQAGRGAQSLTQAAADGKLTLAGAFQLLARSLAELPSPATGDLARARMAALHGREDPLLEPALFPRFLRQAHDAEIADVRKLGETGYELTRRGRPLGELTPSLASARVAEPTGEESPVDSDQSSGLAQGEIGSAAKAPLRFRRGSRALARGQEVPLVGVVRIESDREPPESHPPEPPTAVAAEKPRRGLLGRRRGTGRAKKGT